MSKDPIPSDITLKRLQDYIWQMNIDRGFNTEDASKKLVMLIEEVGELAKAVRKTAGLKFTETTKQTELTEELADVQIVLLGLASLTGIDMRKAVAEKEAKNRQRKWL
jgi:NTP pyrophosphatase (non-canonical NTP hydrolase)